MQVLLFFIRKTKAFFMWLRLDVIFLPFAGFMMNLTYMSRLSKWRSQNKNLKFNDFLNLKWSYQSRFDLYKYLIDKESCSGPVNFFEFGVATGTSFKWWMEQNKDAQSKFYGFDTFTGLPENWNLFKQGAMSNGGKIPSTTDPRGSYYAGLFQDTLRPFLKDFDNKNVNVLHMDADIYSSTLYVLTTFAPYFKKGDIIIFDEFNIPTHEFRAFMDFVNSYYVKYETIAAANNYYFTAVRIL
ncbi:MAG: class I SAM-dependent methyltransferase [Bacteroidia bacterium]